MTIIIFHCGGPHMQHRQLSRLRGAQIEMHIKQQHIKPWSLYWIALECLNITCQLVSLVACIGAVEGIYQDWCEHTRLPLVLLLLHATQA